jgi:hypothetical protein
MPRVPESRSSAFSRGSSISFPARYSAVQRSISITVQVREVIDIRPPSSPS